MKKKKTNTKWLKWYCHRKTGRNWGKHWKKEPEQ